MIALHIKRNRPSAKWSDLFNRLTIFISANLTLEVNTTSLIIINGGVL